MMAPPLGLEPNHSPLVEKIDLDIKTTPMGD